MYSHKLRLVIVRGLAPFLQIVDRREKEIDISIFGAVLETSN